uniref:Cytochrome c oxidase assembly factor 1 homolog n=1 Tax=Anopheles epiroticus TaxID=199890 RepID=A0A182PDS0_9DIPT
MVSLKTLTKAATYIAVGGITAAMIMKVKLEDKIRSQPYYKESLKLLRTHPGAVQLLGEPIKDLSFDLGEETKKFGDGKVDSFAVPVRGTKTRGKYYFWAEMEEDRWVIRRAELELNNEPDRRLLIKGAANREE